MRWRRVIYLFRPHARTSACLRQPDGTLVSFAVKENRENGRRCFLGMLDPSARPLVPKNELTFVIPMSRFKEMLGTMKESALFQHAFSVVKKRINGEIQKETS